MMTKLLLLTSLFASGCIIYDDNDGFEDVTPVVTLNRAFDVFDGGSYIVDANFGDIELDFAWQDFDGFEPFFDQAFTVTVDCSFDCYQVHSLLGAGTVIVNIPDYDFETDISVYNEDTGFDYYYNIELLPRY